MKLIVFDCDGTLVDGQHMIIDAMQTACGACDVVYPGDEAVRQIVGLSLHQAIEVCRPAEAAVSHLALKDVFIERFQQLRLQKDYEEPLYDGVVDVLDQLNDKGYLLGIATGKSKRGLLSTLENHGLSDYFLTLNTADDGPGKPHPSMLHNAMKDVGVSPDQTWMIGDTTFDMEMARTAEVKAVGVSWGYHERAVLQQAGAHHILDHISDLHRVLEA